MDCLVKEFLCKKRKINQEFYNLYVEKLETIKLKLSKYFLK